MPGRYRRAPPRLYLRSRVHRLPPRQNQRHRLTTLRNLPRWNLLREWYLHGLRRRKAQPRANSNVPSHLCKLPRRLRQHPRRHLLHHLHPRKIRRDLNLPQLPRRHLQHHPLSLLNIRLHPVPIRASKQSRRDHLRELPRGRDCRRERMHGLPRWQVRWRGRRDDEWRVHLLSGKHVRNHCWRDDGSDVCGL